MVLPNAVVYHSPKSLKNILALGLLSSESILRYLSVFSSESHESRTCKAAIRLLWIVEVV